MHENRRSIDIDNWLLEVRSCFVGTSPELLSLFDIYAAEARFGRQYIATDLQGMGPGARILEVGAGSLLLSCQLKIEGYDITALEPIGNGFSHFDRMRQMVLNKALSLGCNPTILALPAESLTANNQFDYVFSVNVMEHVDDVAIVLKNVCKSLNVGAVYRFTCPNYLFPYEPHFNIPTFFSKQLTERLLRKKIFDNPTMPDPAGTWQSLNWIDVIQVGKYVRRLPGIKLNFNRSTLVKSLERIASDPDFADRRSPAIRSLLIILVRLHMHYLFAFIPSVFQPIMDCRIEKIAELEAC